MMKCTSLKPETVKPFVVQLTFGDGCKLRKECHYWSVSESNVDLYWVKEGILVQFSTYGHIVRVEEI